MKNLEILSHQQIQRTTTQYDEALKRVQELECSVQTPIVEAELNGALQAAQNLKKRMAFFRVPLEPVNRPQDLRTLKAPQSTIVKLAKLGGSNGKPLPLIASASGTTARPLITLQDLAITEGSSFDPVVAQYLAAVLCGTMVYGGHHSVLEVAEVYNRLLDYKAIKALEEDKKEYKVEAYGNREINMNYYLIGDSASLLPEGMKQAVIAKYCKKNQIAMRQQLERIVDPEVKKNTNTLSV